MMRPESPSSIQLNEHQDLTTTTTYSPDTNEQLLTSGGESIRNNTNNSNNDFIVPISSRSSPSSSTTAPSPPDKIMKTNVTQQSHSHSPSHHITTSPLLVPNELHRFHLKTSSMVHVLQNCISLKAFLPLLITFSIIVPLLIVTTVGVILLNQSIDSSNRSNRNWVMHKSNILIIIALCVGIVSIAISFLITWMLIVWPLDQISNRFMVNHDEWSITNNGGSSDDRNVDVDEVEQSSINNNVDAGNTSNIIPTPTTTTTTTIFYELSRIQSSFLSMAIALANIRRYLPENVSKRVMNREWNESLARESELSQAHVTILSLKLSGFGPLSESLMPNELRALLTELYDSVTHILLEHGATIDVYSEQKENIVAIFNSCVDSSSDINHLKSHQQRACEAAIECRRVIREKKCQSWNRRGTSAHVHCRIGIHSGVALLGSIQTSGASNRGDNSNSNSEVNRDHSVRYTAIGSTVTFTHRLETLSKYYGTKILISENVYDHVHHLFVCRVVDVIERGSPESNRQRSKDTSLRTTLYELLDRRDYSNPVNVLMLEKWTEEWRRHWQEERFDRAIHCLRRALSIREYQNDQCLHLLKGRCEKALTERGSLA